MNCSLQIYAILYEKVLLLYDLNDILAAGTLKMVHKLFKETLRM